MDDEVSDDELADSLHISEEPTSYARSQQTIKYYPIKSHSEETKYLEFWSFLQPLFCYCLKCLAFATIKRYVLKFSKLIVTILSAENHETVWYSQPKCDGCWEIFSCLLQFFSCVMLFNVSKNIWTPYMFPL